MRLLLEADPCEKKIRQYLRGDSLCHLAMVSGEDVGVCVLTHLSEDVLELHNIAVCPTKQGRGIGSALLRRAITQAGAAGVRRIELSTGTFGYQLAFYQRVGFRAEKVVRDYFIDNYDEPVFELGIQHKDMLRLALDIDVCRPCRESDVLE